MKSLMTGMLVLLASSLMAQKPAIVTGTETGWYQIGRITADFDKERESIIVMGRDEFNAIKLKVNDAAISIEGLKIHFEGGKVQDVRLEDRLGAGDETRKISLDAEDREIDKVEFTYHTVADGSGDKAEVELYGFKGTNTDEQQQKAESTGFREEDEERQRYDETRERDIRNGAREAGDEFEEAAEAAGDGVENTVEDIGEAAEDVGQEVEEAAEEVSDEFDDPEETETDAYQEEEWQSEAEETREESREWRKEVRDEQEDMERERYQEGIQNEGDRREYRSEDEREEGADNVIDETREHANKLNSEIFDRELEDRAGPDGQEIYVDDQNNFYYIDEFGNRMYVTPEELTPRVRE